MLLFSETEVFRGIKCLVSFVKKAGVLGCLVQSVSVSPAEQRRQREASHRLELIFEEGDAELMAEGSLGKAEEADCVPKEAVGNLEKAGCSSPAEELVFAASLSYGYDLIRKVDEAVG